MIGSVVMGFCIGSISAIMALDAGFSLSLALLAYSGTGTMTYLLLAACIYLISRLRRPARNWPTASDTAPRIQTGIFSTSPAHSSQAPACNARPSTRSGLVNGGMITPFSRVNPNRP